MAIEVIKGHDGVKSCMYDTVTDRAFGPIFNSWGAEDFLEWYNKQYPLVEDDLRKLDIESIEELKQDWRLSEDG